MEFPIKKRCLVFDRVIERLEEQADMKTRFLLCGSGKPIFENGRRGRMEDGQELAHGYGVAKALVWILGATSSRGAEVSTWSSLA